jgi:hypothetical protein
MHTIDNAYSYKARRDNWIQINNFLKRNPQIKNLKNEDVEKLVENKNNEVLTFLMKLYEELTNRKLPALEGIKFKTDVDNLNKSYLLKDTGEMELINKNRDATDPRTEDQKTVSNII